MTAAAVRAGVLPLSGADNSLYVMQYDMQAPAVVQCFSTNCYMLPLPLISLPSLLFSEKTSFVE